MVRNQFPLGMAKTGTFVMILAAASAGGASAANDVTCSGGSITAGVYSSLTIAGACTVDLGSVTVEHNVTVLPGASLVATRGGVGAVPSSSDLTVGGNLDVQAGGVLDLGCEPAYYPCPNDPAFRAGPGTYTTHHTIAGNLSASNALGIVIHHSAVLGNLSVNGGGDGGLSPAFSLPPPNSPPPVPFTQTPLAAL